MFHKSLINREKWAVVFTKIYYMWVFAIWVPVCSKGQLVCLWCVNKRGLSSRSPVDTELLFC